ncbi:MAG TPA: FtsW/RodA/SpoVE family cell cycle protein [Thermomicrobiales bacterium]|nr:FtsW/RodA/SpoVE family cell cycle protein [Thermomicrobiales bacterium]
MVTFRPSYMQVKPGDTARDRWRDFDPILLVTMLVLMGFGILAIWSAVGLPPLTSFDNSGTFQAVFGIVGLGVMLATASVDYRFLNTLAWPLYGFGIVLLVAVQVFGVSLGGARNWFDFGFFLFQPSEFVKITTLIALASFIAARGDEMKSLGNFIGAGLIVALPAGLVLIGPDLGMTMVYVALWGSTLIVMRTRMLYLVLLMVSLPLLGWIGWEYILADYQKTRFIVSFNPDIAPLDEGFQILQARISIGAGGIFGEGLAGGSQSQLDLLTVRDSDFIFAHASGMFGFVGMLGLFLAQIIFLWRCLKVTEVARDQFGQVLAVGITGVIFFQAFLNIGMNVGLMPVTGITLPFVSYGLSSLWANLIMVGILQSIRMHHRKLAFIRT